MGGFGTFSYATRHPDLFTSAVSLSGAVDTNVASSLSSTPYPLRTAGRPARSGATAATEELLWRAHNPADLAENLRGLALWLRTGQR